MAGSLSPDFTMKSETRAQGRRFCVSEKDTLQKLMLPRWMFADEALCQQNLFD